MVNSLHHDQPGGVRCPMGVYLLHPPSVATGEFRGSHAHPLPQKWLRCTPLMSAQFSCAEAGTHNTTQPPSLSATTCHSSLISFLLLSNHASCCCPPPPSCFCQVELVKEGVARLCAMICSTIRIQTLASICSYCYTSSTYPSAPPLRALPLGQYLAVFEFRSGSMRILKGQWAIECDGQNIKRAMGN